ncbi:hypothetical protein DSO57_1038589 [Entomophthora muscae]|uniref:Uncharacterized protein n=1 Tax=Entomophthora muscae TaxID=34485 RepID=A0ACC2SBM7_9FUNG|nr:hypothetical protein DSO57_1038589 [Entomophthora muscae]
MQTLSGYKFNERQRGPLGHGFLESLILPDTGSPSPKPQPQLWLFLHSSWSLPLVPLLRHPNRRPPGTLLYDVLVAQHSSPDSQAICAKLSPVSASNVPYTLKDRIIYQNNNLWVPKELRPCVMTEHHDPPLFGHPGTKKLLELIRCTYSWVGIIKAVGP